MIRLELRWIATASVAAILLAAAGAPAQSTGGGGGAGGGGGGGSFGGGGGGGGGGSSNAASVGSTQSGSIDNSTILGSFDNVGTGRGSTAISTSNLFAPYYYNPYAQGLLTQSGQSFRPISNAGFGQALFSSTTGGSTTAARSGFGNTGGMGVGTTGTRTGAGTGTSFGGTSLGGGTTFGSTAGMGGVNFGGGTSNLGNRGMTAGLTGGTAGLRSGTTGTGTSFAGGSLGPSIGRTGPVIGSALTFTAPPRLEVERPAEIQSIVARSSALSAPAGVSVQHNAGVVVLRGTVASADERRIAENMLRLQPGVRDVRNELEIRGGGQ